MGALLAIAVSAAVVEETAFRGYMQKPMEDRYGVVPPILVTGVMFWFVHLDKVTVTHLPGHLAASAVFGLLACFTRSLAPAMVAHAAADLLLQPAYLSRSPQFVWTALSAHPVWQGESATLAQKLELICRAAKPVNAVGRCVPDLRRPRAGALLQPAGHDSRFLLSRPRNPQPAGDWRPNAIAIGSLRCLASALASELLEPVECQYVGRTAGHGARGEIGEHRNVGSHERVREPRDEGARKQGDESDHQPILPLPARGGWYRIAIICAIRLVKAGLL